MCKTLTIIPYTEHDDLKREKLARTVGVVYEGEKRIQLRARRGDMPGFFLYWNRGDRSFVTKDYFSSSEEALEHLKEFAKSLVMSFGVLLPMWYAVQAVFP